MSKKSKQKKIEEKKSSNYKYTSFIYEGDENWHINQHMTLNEFQTSFIERFDYINQRITDHYFAQIEKVWNYSDPHFCRWWLDQLVYYGSIRAYNETLELHSKIMPIKQAYKDAESEQATIMAQFKSVLNLNYGV